MIKTNSTKRLVIVDDEEMVISSIRNYLLLETDYEVLSFTSPKKALKQIVNHPVNLAISDFLMPEMDGIEFLKEVKKLNSQATLILLTGYADKENAIKAINEIGIYKYIEKPWDNEELKITIDNALERTDLVINLENKINELNEAQKALKVYNDKLEHLVKERTYELTYTNAELKAIINSTADGILTLNENFVITSANTTMENLSGLTKNKLNNKPIETIISTKISEKDLTGPILDNDCFVLNHITKKNIPVELSVAPIITDSPSNNNNFVVVVRNISAQKETERLREDFIATLTHDQRTPLLAAIQTLNFFLDGSLGELTEKQKQLLDTMRTSNKDMLGLVNALLEVYKYESGELKLFKDKLCLNDLISTCIEEVKSLLDKKQLSVITNITDNIVIEADKKELRRVLANFIGNAISFTPVSGKITVKAKVESGNIKFSITDTGRGIPESDLNKLFQRFSQGTSKQRSTGTGLGLYLSRQIIEAHGGNVWVKSKENSGSTFGFTIRTGNNNGK